MSTVRFTRHDIEAGFTAIAELARAADKVVEIAVYGGTALVLSYPGRPATKDVDAVAHGDAAFVRNAARRVADDRGWPGDWLNDAVKGWLSTRDRESLSLFRTFPSEAEPGLRVFVASPQYLFAMKCLAFRVDATEQSRDVEDIKLLLNELGLASAEAALDLIEQFYPASRIPPKTRFGIEELFGKLTTPEQG